MTSQGSSYSRFQRALTTHNLAIITAAARELPAIDLHDAARITAVIARQRPERLDAAGVRWLHRYCTEHDPTLTELARATAALQTMREDHDRGLRELLHTTRAS